MKMMQIQVNLSGFVQRMDEEANVPVKRTLRTFLACWLGKHEWRVSVDEQQRIEAMKEHDHDTSKGVTIKCALCPKEFKDANVSVPEVLGISLIATAKVAVIDDDLAFASVNGSGGMSN